MSQLADTWATAAVSEVATFVRGVTYTKADARESAGPGLVGVLRANNIADARLDLTDLVYVPKRFISDEQQLQTGDVVIATSSGSASVVGKAAQVRTPMDLGFGAFCGVMRPFAEMDPRYFGHFFQTQEYRLAASAAARGVNINNLKRSHFDSFRIAFPSRRGQARIADKLDSVLARVDGCSERLDRVPLILKRFREAVLEAAVSGRLTEEWRARSNRSRDAWSQTTVDAQLTAIESGVNVQCEERPPNFGEKGLVKISAVTWGTFDDKESKTLLKGHDVPESTRIRAGDFLISRANTLELVGACVIVEKVTRPVYLSDKVLRLVVDNDVKPWLLISLQSRTGRAQIEALASGNQLSMRNLSQANLRTIELAMPAPDERDEIVRRVRDLFALADGLEAKYRAAVERVEKLTPSVLAKAFRGELVPQDPRDEPADKLLERIRAERESVGSTGSSSRTRAKRRAPVKRITRRAKK